VNTYGRTKSESTSTVTTRRLRMIGTSPVQILNFTLPFALESQNGKSLSNKSISVTDESLYSCTDVLNKGTVLEVQ
jgi:hypothetical protein